MHSDPNNQNFTGTQSTFDYYPFGMGMPGRGYAGDGYKYGFNGKEKDDELLGDGNAYDFGARIYDPRVGRWMSVDPLQQEYSDLSPYQFCANEPIFYKDPDGRGIVISMDDEGNVTVTATVYIYDDVDNVNGVKKIKESLGMGDEDTKKIITSSGTLSNGKSITINATVIPVTKAEAQKKIEAERVSTSTQNNYLAVADQISEDGANERNYEQNVGAISWEQLNNKQQANLYESDTRTTLKESCYGLTNAEETLLHFVLHTGGQKGHAEDSQTPIPIQCDDVTGRTFMLPLLSAMSGDYKQMSNSDYTLLRDAYFKHYKSPMPLEKGGEITAGTNRGKLMTPDEMKTHSKDNKKTY